MKIPAKERTPETLQQMAAEVCPGIRRVDVADDWKGDVFAVVPLKRSITEKWIDKILAEQQREPGRSIITLIPFRSDTRWCRRLAKGLICLVRGRIRFNEHSTGAMFPSAVVYFGHDRKRFAEVFSRAGFFANMASALYSPDEREARDGSQDSQGSRRMVVAS